MQIEVGSQTRGIPLASSLFSLISQLFQKKKFNFTKMHAKSKFRNNLYIGRAVTLQVK